MLKKLLLFVTLIASVPLHANEAKNSDNQEPIYNVRTLSLDLTAKLAWHAILDCRQRGYSVAVAVVDRGGNVQSLHRDRFAGPHTIKTAIRKAWTANSFRQNTGNLADLLKRGVIPNQVQHNPGALLVGGGVIIESQGGIIGGVGVSGAPPGKSEKQSIDGACARAGIESIRENLEFD